MDESADRGRKPSPTGPAAQAIGVFDDVSFEVETGSFVTVVAELCIVGLFTRQAAIMWSGGALADLEASLNGAIGALRKDRFYSGELGHKMLLSSPPAPMTARAILLVGLGDPDAWSPDVAEQVTAIAMREALGLGVKSAVFAPCLKDSGLGSAASVGTSAGMLAGARKALKSLPQGAPRPALRRWIFVEGLEWIDFTLDKLRLAAKDSLNQA